LKEEREEKMKARTRGSQQKKGGVPLLRCLVLLLAAALPMTGCGEKTAPNPAQVKRPIISGVSVAKVAPAVVDEFYDAVGTVRAAKTSVVAGRMMGVVTSLAVKEGDAVEKGQLLLTIDDRDVVQKVRAAGRAIRRRSRPWNREGRIASWWISPIDAIKRCTKKRPSPGRRWTSLRRKKWLPVWSMSGGRRW